MLMGHGVRETMRESAVGFLWFMVLSYFRDVIRFLNE